MRKVEHRLRLDLLRGGNQGYIRVKRGENGARRLAIALYMHSVPYMADAGTTAVFRAIKPDNTKLFNSATITDNVVTVGLTTQTVAALGTVRCELSIYGTNNELLYSPQFDIIVEDYLYSDTAIESTDEYTDLTEAISKVNNIVSTEAARVAAENQRVANETARGKAETERETAETARAAAETARAAAETERASAETTRASAESSRAFSENIRKQAEKQRVSSETQRDTAETARSNAESSRRSAETARVQEFNAIKADAQDAATAEAARALAEESRMALYNQWDNATASVKGGENIDVNVVEADGHKNFDFTIPSDSLYCETRTTITNGDLETIAREHARTIIVFDLPLSDVYNKNPTDYGLPADIAWNFTLINGPSQNVGTKDYLISYPNATVAALAFVFVCPQTLIDGNNIYMRRLSYWDEKDKDEVSHWKFEGKDWEPVGGTADAVTYTPQTLTEEQQEQARVNIGAGQPVFAVNLTEVEIDNYTADKTTAEIEAAYQAGCTIVCRATGPLMGTYIPVELPLLSRMQERVFYFGAEQLSSQSSGKRLDRLNVQISDSGVNVSADAARIYEKSEYGIPKSDLAEDVQTSLAKADTAISYNSQTLTEEQKSQARTNIGAVDENLGCNKYNIHVTTTSGTTKDFTYYTNEGEIRQPTEAVDSSIRTAFLGLTLWPSAKGISENLAKTLSKQYKILYDANYIDSPCCIIKSPLESGDKVLLSYHSSDNTVQVSGNWTDGYYNIIYDVANDALTHFYVSNNIYAVNGAVNQLVMSAAPTEDMHIATKQYVDTAKAEGQQLGLTSATPGQIIKVKTVQDGKPTGWEAVNMPGGDKWEKIKEITIAEGAEESNALTINADENGNTFRLKKARLCAKFPAYTGTSTIPNYSFAMINGKTTGGIAPLLYTSVWPKISTSGITGTIYYVDVSGAQQIEHAQVSTSAIWSNNASNAYNIYGSSSDQRKTIYGDTLWAKPITSIGGVGMLIYPGCHFVLYGVRE